MPATKTRIAGRPVLPSPNWPADATLAAFAAANNYEIGGGDALRAFKPLRYGNNEKRNRRLWRIIDRPDVLTALVERGGRGNAGLQRRAVAVITHTLGRLQQHDIPLGIVCDELPLSWYGCHAYLLRSDVLSRQQELDLLNGRTITERTMTHEQEHAALAAELDRLDAAIYAKSLSPCGLPPHPEMLAQAKQLRRATRDAWSRCSGDYRTAWRAKEAERDAAIEAELDTLPWTDDEIEAAHEALAEHCMCEDGLTPSAHE